MFQEKRGSKLVNSSERLKYRLMFPKKVTNSIFRWVHLSLYEGVSDRRMVRPSVRNLFFSNAKNGQFSLGKSSGQSKFDIAECAECSECA